MRSGKDSLRAKDFSDVLKLSASQEVCNHSRSVSSVFLVKVSFYEFYHPRLLRIFLALRSQVLSES